MGTRPLRALGMAREGNLSVFQLSPAGSKLNSLNPSPIGSKNRHHHITSREVSKSYSQQPVNFKTKKKWVEHQLSVIFDRFLLSDIVGTRRRGINTYIDAFEGRELVGWLMDDPEVGHHFEVDTRADAELIGKRMWKANVLRHVRDKVTFKDNDEIYILIPRGSRPGGPNDLSGKMTREEYLHRAQRRERDSWVILTLAQKIFLFFDEPWQSLWGRLTSMVILSLIAVSCCTFILQTTGQYRKDVINQQEDSWFYTVESLCITVFTIEYIMQLLTCGSMSSLYWLTASEDDLVLNSKKEKLDELDDLETEQDIKGLDVQTVIKSRERYTHRHLSICLKVCRFMSQPLNIIDLISIIPFYLEIIFSGADASFTVFRVLRLARVFRLFKLSKYIKILQTFARVMAKSLDALALMFFFVVLGALIFGSMMFYAEGGEWNEGYQMYMRPTKDGLGLEPTPFSSIPACFWFIFVTTTTVGYGDHYPTTWTGKVVATITMHMGVLVLALPVTIMGANFALEMDAPEDDEEEEVQREEEAKLANFDKRMDFMKNVEKAERANESPSVSVVSRKGEDDFSGDEPADFLPVSELPALSMAHMLGKIPNDTTSKSENKNSINNNNITNNSNNITNNNIFIINNSGLPQDALALQVAGINNLPGMPQFNANAQVETKDRTVEDDLISLLEQLKPLTAKVRTICNEAETLLDRGINHG